MRFYQKLKKNFFLCLNRGTYCILNRVGLNVGPDKISAIVNIPTPKNIKKVRCIVGIMSWYKNLKPNFSHLVAPLTNSSKKGKKLYGLLNARNP